jgi:hypothetical protein
MRQAPSAMGGKRTGQLQREVGRSGGRERGVDRITASVRNTGETIARRSLPGTSLPNDQTCSKGCRTTLTAAKERRRPGRDLHSRTEIDDEESPTSTPCLGEHVLQRVSNTDVNSVLHRSATRENEESEDEKTVALYVEFRSLEAPTLGARSESQRSSADGSQQSAFGGQDRHIRRGSFVQHVVCRLRRLGQQVVEDVRGVGIAPVVVPVEGRASSSGRT